MLILIIIIIAVALWVISAQRNLVSKDELCRNAMSQIGVQQSSRWDALTALVELIKSYNEHEYNTLKDVIAQRQQISSASTAAQADSQEQALGAALKQINVVAERYPDLKANDMYNKTMESVNVYENQVRLSRMTYNDCVTKFNRLVRQLPESLIANLFGFKEKDYLAEDKTKTAMPSMKF